MVDLTANELREQRIAARVAARASWPEPDPEELAARKRKAAQRPLRQLLVGMAGYDEGLRSTRRAFSEMMANAGIARWEWEALADLGTEELEAELDRMTDRLYAAGYYVAVGPRGGRSLARRSN